MAARLVPRRPTVVETSTSMVARCPEPAPEQLVRLLLDRMLRLQTLPCRCRTATGIPARRLQPRTVPNPVTPRTGTLRTEAPYHRQVPARHDKARALPRLARAATIPLASPPETRLPAGVHGPTREPLDFGLSRFFTGNRQPPTACRLLQRDVTRARPRPARTPTLAQQAAPNQMAPPLMKEPAGLSQVRGPRQNALRDPHQHDRSHRWIYPNLTDPSTPCHQPVPPDAWKPAGGSDPAVADLSRTRRPGMPSKLDLPVGPPPERSRERANGTQDPGCLPPRGLPTMPTEVARWSARPTSRYQRLFYRPSSPPMNHDDENGWLGLLSLPVARVRTR